MTKEEQKRILREQIAGHREFDKLEIEAERARSIEDRLAAFARIEELGKHLPSKQSREDDDELMETWIKIRQRYESTNRQ